MGKFFKPAMFSTGRRRSPISVRSQLGLTQSVGKQLANAGLSYLRSTAGPVVASIVSGLIGGRNSRGRAGQAAISNLAGQALGGVGRAISWLVGGKRGAAPNVAPREIKIAEEIVAKVREEVPSRSPSGPDRSVTGDIPQPGFFVPKGGILPDRGGTGRTDSGGGGKGSGTGRKPPGRDDGGDGRGDQGGNENPGDNRPGGVVMTRTPQSSNVHSYGYDPATATLYVRYLASHLNPDKVEKTKKFKGHYPNTHTEHTHVGKGAFGGRAAKPGPMYAYDGVPERVFRRMQAAVSKGIFIWDEVRIRGTIHGHKFRYRLVAPGAFYTGPRTTVLYVPRRATKNGFVARKITLASGARVLSNMSSSTARRSAVRNR